MSENRTNEFFSMAKSLKESDPMLMSASNHMNSVNNTNANSNNNNKLDAKKKQNFQELRNFHSQAAGISKDIASTSALLTQLAEKVRHKSLFHQDAETQEVNHLVVRIKTSIENLNSRLDQAQRTIAQQKRSMGKHSQAAMQSENLVTGLQTEFAQAANTFKTVLQQRTESLKETDDFKRQVYGNNNKDDMEDIPDMGSHLSAPPPVFGSHNHHSLQHANSTGAFPTLDLTSGLGGFDTTTSPSGGTGVGVGSTGSVPSSLPRPHGISGAIGGGGSTLLHRKPNSAPNTANMYSGASSFQPGGHNHGPLTPLDIQRMEEENGGSQMMQLIPTQQDYLQSRAEAMSTVETNIVELGTIFNKLAGLVSEHREMVQRVEDNVEDANANVLMSMNALTDTLTNLKTNKMLALKVFSILTLFIILFIVFFA